jgi:hypothetical protein
MTEKEKETFKDLIGKYGTVLKSHWEMHGFGQGSIYSHVIQWPGGKKTGLHDGTYDNKDFTPVGLGPMSAILEDFHYKFAGDLEAAFPGRKIEFGRGERILIDSKIVPGILCSTPRTPYKQVMKL